jgi:WhiB family redox-sensing transcriptional regulator
MELAMLIFEHPEWMTEGACRNENPNVFFPPPGLNQFADEAKKICARCNVRVTCLEYALENEEAHGIWGGMSARQRNVILRNRRVLNTK